MATELTYENGYRDGTTSSAGMPTNDVMAQRIRYKYRLEGTPRRGGLYDYINGLVDAYQDEVSSRNRSASPAEPAGARLRADINDQEGLPRIRPAWSQQ